jgi:glycosyltransferase involved in cell wall biosynthesis
MRMMHSSGIGRYIRQLVPLVLGGGNLRAALIGDPARIGELWRGSLPASAMARPSNDSDEDPDPVRAANAVATPHPAVTVHPCTAPIYSIREQIEVPRALPSETETFWAPHYNFPILARGRLVVTVHDLLHIAHPEYVRGTHRRLYARAMFSRLRRQAGAIIVDSRFTADELVRLVGVDHRRVTVIHLGVDAAWFAPPAAGSARPRPYFLYVGNIKPHKNLRVLVEAFGRVRNSLPHDLVIAGRREGLLGGDDTVLAAAAAFGDRIHFAGEVGESTLRELVAYTEALVIPSRYEGFGLPALEAMAAGAPVVVSNAGSLPEVCGSAALYFDPDDVTSLAGHLLRIARDPVLREDLSAAGRTHARGFTWERCADLTREVLLR